MNARQARREILAALGAQPEDQDPLIDYTENHFRPEQVAWPIHLPLASEAFVSVWSEYAQTVRQNGSLAPLAEALPQLRFPIERGISQTPAYREATRRGVVTAGGPGLGLKLERPDQIRLELYGTAAGQLPVVVVRRRADFVSLVRAFTHRNEPSPVPDSQGACMVAGYNNWDRIRRYREAWEAEGGSPDDWSAEFAALANRKHLYQDRFIILSDGPYSAVPASEMGMTASEWRGQSLVIRREHECTHYLTKRVFGSMENRLHDEFLADYAGIAAATGRYRADWFLRFMGLEGYPSYRATGRLGNYRGDPPLSARAFGVLQRMVVRAARALDSLCAGISEPVDDVRWRSQIIIALACTQFELLASDDADAHLRRAVDEVSKRVVWADTR